MKFTVMFIFIAMLIISAACKKQEAKQVMKQPRLTKLWESPKKMLTSESAYYDQNRDVIYVSNINGQPLEKNEQGFMSKLNPKGEVLVEKWVEGLDAPKGIGIYKNKLYVSDIDQVVEIDIKEGKVTLRYPAEGAKFLNDISVDSSGNVYISDTNTKRIYRISEGLIDVWLESDLLDNANGLYVEDGSLLIGTAGSMLKADLLTKEISVYIKDTGGIDGIAPDGLGNYLISDWTGNIHLVNPNKEKIKLLDSTPQKINAADIFYVISKKMLLVPTFFDNRVMAYTLEE